MLTIRSALTDELTDPELTELRTVVDRAFDGVDDGFSDHDWDHALGGCHFLGLLEDAPVAHASVVPRLLHVGERALEAGYVEAVAVAPEHRREGHGHTVMAALGEFLTSNFELGALSAAERNHGLYGRLGWRVWPGPTAVMVDGKPQPTPEDDGGVLILETPRSGPLDPEAALICDWRAGDVW